MGQGIFFIQSLLVGLPPTTRSCTGHALLTFTGYQVTGISEQIIGHRGFRATIDVERSFQAAELPDKALGN